MSGILAAFVGTGAVVRLSNDNVTTNVVAPSVGTSSFTVDNLGTASDNIGTSYAWLTGGLPANYEIFATLNSGTLNLGTTGSWLNLGTTRTWRVQRSTVGSAVANITLQIRPVGGSVVATATIALEVDVS